MQSSTLILKALFLFMTDQNLPNQDVQRLKELLQRLSMTQLRFVVARLDARSDKEAAEAINASPATVKSWENKAEVDEAILLMRFDGLLTALEMRRRNLAKAMAVKIAGLDSRNERIRQDVATEIIEAELGKAIAINENRNIDLNNLTDEQLQQLAAGKDVIDALRG